MSLVIPRDFFNHANLLKCYGKITINLEIVKTKYEFMFIGDDNNFIIEEDEDGNTFVSNVVLSNDFGKIIELSRPLNSRQEWPLLAYDKKNRETINVFRENGNFTKEFELLLTEE